MMEIDSLVPHRAPMLLIDAVESFDLAEKRATAHVRISSSSPFFDGVAVPAWVSIEYMAQASAMLVGLRDRAVSPGMPPRPGLLLGTRRLELSVEAFPLGSEYSISSMCTFEDAEAAAFQCEMMDASGTVVASASLNAYRPPDMVSFLKEHKLQ